MARAPRTSYDSGSKSNLGPQAPVRSDAADTSRDAERIISRNQNQLSNPFGVVNVPAPANRNNPNPYGQPAKTLLPKVAGAQNKTNVMSEAEMFAAVGEPRAPRGYNEVNDGGKIRANRNKR